MALKDYFHFDRQDESSVAILLLLLVAIVILYKMADAPQLKAIVRIETENEIELEITRHIDSTYQLKYGQPQIRKLSIGQKIDINKADTNALKRIPGIGSAYARRIIDYRSKIGRIDSLIQLEKVKGIKGKRLIKLSEYIYIEEKE